MIVIAHDLPAMNMQRQLGVSTRKDKKATERLSSGFRINRAADDAAGLTISEKMRAQIRGLNQGTENAQDGVSWVQIGDGALNEVHDMLHRMTELSIQSLNETYTDDDRAAMEAEFNQLQSQIDNITQNTQFNTKPIFSEHEPTYYKVEGNLSWPHDQVHDVFSPANTLVINYSVNKDDPPVSVTLTVPEGSYTTQELADELEDVIASSPLAYDPKLHFEYTAGGTFNANLEGGARIGSVDGGLASLLNDTYSGGSAGSLIGTTIFTSESVRLPIVAGRNDSMSFVIEDFSGNKTTKTVTIPPGSYNRGQIIDLLNNALDDTGVSATRYGTGIMMAGDDCIISHFKGNMFQIDGAAYTSVFYDNVYHGQVRLTPGTFTGGAVLPASSYSNGRDAEHSSFEIISGVNDTLTFSPNGTDTQTTITIPAGRYQIGNMVSTLNTLFSQNGLDLTATSHTSGNFSGIKITSRLQGATSDVGLSSTSSAYDTLFVDRKYNVYGTQATVTNETTQDSTSVFRGGKPFSSSSYNNLPLVVKAGENDSFKLNLDGNSYTVTVPAATYTSAAAVAGAVNSALAGTDLGASSGKISASTDANGRITLTADISARVVNLTASAVTGNKGYQDVFTTSYRNTITTYTGSSNRLDRVFPDPTSISESEKNIVVESSDGSLSYTITLPTGDAVTHQQIIDSIGSTPGRSSFTDIRYTQYNVSGYDRNFTRSGQGVTTPSTAVYSNTGVTVGGAIEGQVGYTYTTNTPANITIPLKSSFTPGPGSDRIQMVINGRTEIFTFDHKAYTPSSFASDLQQKIDAAYGTNIGGATVVSSGNGIKITARLKDEYGVEQPARDTSITCSSATSSLLAAVNATESGARLVTPDNAPLRSSGINVSAGDTFEFFLNGEKKTVNLTPLSNAGPAAFASMLNSALAAQSIPVTASPQYSNGGYHLVLDSRDKGSSVSMSYASASGGTVTDKIYNDLTTAGYARAQNIPVQSDITIEDGKNAFRYSVNGVDRTASLTSGTYTRQSFLDELNNRLTGASASIDGNGYLIITSDRKGAGSSVGLNYDSSDDSAMRSIWGRRETRVPALNASFDPTDHLVLTSKDGTTFRIRSSGTPFIDHTVSASTQATAATAGFYSAKHATMDGGDLTISASSPLVIDEWNDTLKFNYTSGSTSRQISFDIEHGTYTSYEQLRSQLQSKLDGAAGAGELTATVDAHGVTVKAVEAGYTRAFGSSGYGARITNPPIFGDFYDKVMNHTTEQSQKLTPSAVSGSNVAGSSTLPYVVGRRNVKDSPVKIKTDINDTLSIDFAYTDSAGRAQNRTFTMKLDAGTYQGASLANMIQDKLNEQLASAGLANDLIEVGIGGTNANVAGVDNDKVLTFKLSNSLPLPSSGNYVIDGIGGNAAFSVFYQTTGELVPAYVEGARDISEGITVEEDHNTLSFSTDGNTYSLEIPPGKYTDDEIVTKLNSLLSGAGAPVIAEKTEEGRLKFSHKQMGNHPITGLSGPARGSLFFNEYGGEGEEDPITIQFSSNRDDNKTIDRPPMSTAFLGINTITISKVKYARKAVEKIQGALDKVSEVRSYFGASQNAIEHVINRNNITSENTQAAESRIRDTDMAKTMFEHETNRILMQAGQALLAQAGQNRQSVLQLLQ